MPIHATIIGRLVKEPARRQVGAHTVTDLRIASDHGFGGRKSTTYVAVSLWGKDGDRAVEHLHKGDPVCCTGDLYVREYETATAKGQSLELDNARWSFLPRSAEREPEAAPQQRRQPSGGRNTGRDTSRDGEPYSDDDIPF